MKGVKKILSLCLVLALLLGAAPMAFAAGNSVPEGHWAHDVLTKWAGSGVLPDADPERVLTAGELAGALARLFGGSAADVMEAAGGADASAAVTREQALRSVAAVFGVDPEEGATAFADDGAIDPAYRPYVNAFRKLGYVRGKDGGRFDPKAGLTCAEAAQILENVTADRGMPEQPDSALKAGAGAGEIVFDRAMFPEEGFSGEVHLNPYARVLVLEQGIRTAIVSLELVNVPSDVIRTIKEIVSEKTGTPAENIWVHATHAITTPHGPSDAAKLELYKKAVTAAVTEAAAEAAAAFQPAVMGIGTGTSNVNANHGIQLSDGWYIGTGSTMPSNKEMTVLRFNTLDGAPIGFLISYGIKPTAIDNVEMKAETRKLSSDVPGVACQLMEEEFGVPAMFCMPAAADQIPREVTTYYVENEKGEAVKVELSVEEGIEIVDRLGAEMGEDAISIAKGITCTDEKQAIVSADTSFTWPSKSGDGEVKIDVRGLAIGDDLAFVGFKPEVNALTEQQLWAASPYEHTLLMSFVDGDQKYMPDAEAHDLQTWEFKRSGTAKGSAEQFVATAAQLLEGIKSGEIKGNTGVGSETGTGGAQVKKTIQMGGYSWIVLDEQDGKMLVLSERILENRAYHSAGGAITWENSEIRAYLNGEFYDKTFSDAEKAKIVETTIENKSNPQYGIAGGNATTDKVFLLSLGEVEKYLNSGVELLRGLDVQTGAGNWWHLRSPGEATDVNASVNVIGLVDYHGVNDGVKDPTGGVRPALWITAD